MNWYNLVFGAKENTLVCLSADWCVSCEWALASNLVSLKPAVQFICTFLGSSPGGEPCRLGENLVVRLIKNFAAKPGQESCHEPGCSITSHRSCPSGAYSEENSSIGIATAWQPAQQAEVC